ncbi:leucyl aminopeptidase [Buchnera aphidicola (Thelaxes californica)]|uniref:Probable cytosol aminopeptidase n=1 Tax=Buchnera aphidicola (Thelaxes californica) TaxID=1315998 RepID=A0A4D6YP06_9GAMM|nr:leucyl aminopeptidase [Buchnera aphidicola]QCI26815.1 leucyl aminopeptidase [Buchnera aphidicola (Thelaxes californica)]
MNFIIDDKTNIEKYNDCIVLGIFKTSNNFYINYDVNDITKKYIINTLLKVKFQAKIGSTILLLNVPKIDFLRVLLVGCGDQLKINDVKFKKIVHNTIHVIKKEGIQNVFYCLILLFIKNKTMFWKINVIIQKVAHKYYIFNFFKNEKKKTNIEQPIVIFPISDNKYKDEMKESIKYSQAVISAIKITKDLSNFPPNICNSKFLVQKSKELAQKYPNNISIEILNKKELKKLGMHAYLSVGEGSKNESYMSIIHFNKIKHISQKPIVLIGKGVTFDSGGISIKPSKNMHQMKFDMSGAATVLGIMSFLAKLKLPLYVIGILAISENMLGESAYRPGDIIKTMSGKTVEIINTDAEGRLLLCDVLTYVERFFFPDLVIDIATLTGACIASLGDVCSGVFSNNQNLEKELIKSGLESDDKVWALPLFSEYYQQLKSDCADMTNVSASHPGAITAACFLSLFAKKFVWAHLDIAGTSVQLKNSQYPISTGRPIPLLSHFLLHKSDNNYII